MENKAIKDRMIKDIRNNFELENKEENYYKLTSVGNFYSKNYTEYENNDDRNKTLPNEEYHHLLIQTNFLTIISINLFYCCNKVFTCMNTWMIGKNTIKPHYLKKIFKAS